MLKVEVKELLQKGFWTLMVRSLGAGLTFLMTLLFARWLGAESFGVFSLGLTIMMILAVLARWGTDQVLLKQVGANWQSDPSLAKGYVVSAIKLVLIFSLLLSIVIVFTYESIANSLFNKPKLSEVLFLFGLLVVPFAINYTLGEFYKGMGRPVLSSFLQNVITPFMVVVLGGVIVNTGFGFGLEFSILVYGIGIVTALIFSLFFWSQALPSVKITKLELKKLFKEGRPMLLISSGGLVMAWSDMIVLGVWGEAEELGIYSAASKTVLMTSLILIAMNSITAPKYARLYKDNDMKGLAKLAENSSKILLSLVLLPTGILLIFPEWIMGWFGNEFVVGATILMILTVGQFINVVCGSVGYILTMTGNEVKMRNIIFFTAVINVLLSIVLVKIYGVMGVAIATAFSIILWNVWAMFEVKRQLGFWTIPLSLYRKTE